MNRRSWPVIIIGGGPAATLQVQRFLAAGAAPEDLLVIGENWGAPGMAFLGSSRLQSYAHELELEAGALPPLTSPGFVQPTGTEFDQYAQSVLRRSGAVRCQGTVTDLREGPEGFDVSVRGSVGVLDFRTSCVILATGTRPRQPPEWLRRAGARTYDQAYVDVQSGRTDDYRNRPVFVVGSGNSAMQTASLLASVSGSVTVLAIRYLGMYPSETLDRFAWRAPSQLTCELVVKSSHRERVCDGGRMCVRFLVYRGIEPFGDRMRIDIRSADNGHQIGRHSRPSLHPHVPAVVSEDGWREEWPLESSTVVWATGCEPVYPDSELIRSLPKDEDGYLWTDADGQTGHSGLFVTGACAGRRAVNEMVPAQIAVP
ncbi:FAD-dependent oxidoreductase [Actinocorallia sp. B10E7]|uniref:FAD-dependent oxidoreductase n=1 Tax=Actinocorallia sp. B10E7 TaxID=3153558 RepID=UPI00325D0B63